MLWCDVVWCGVVCCDVVWCVMWCDVVWCCVVWYGVMWCGVIWYGVNGDIYTVTYASQMYVRSCSVTNEMCSTCDRGDFKYEEV